VAADPKQATLAAAGPPSKPAPWNDPQVRALFFQALVLGGVILFAAFLVRNTLNNLEQQGIASGFDFLSKTAGFSIAGGFAESWLHYREDDSYGKSFLVGLLNTIVVSAFGIVLATIVGFIVGVARLSTNWLISMIAMAYIEVIRNVPLLLQIFFWYFAMLRPLPSPRGSVEIFDSFFLNNRGLYYPQPVPGPGFWLVPGMLALAIVGVVVLRRWARRRQEATGEQFPVFLTSLGLIVSLPLLAAVVTGFPLTWDYPELVGFNFKGGSSFSPEFIALLAALSIYTASFIAEIVRAGILSVSHGQTEAAFALGLSRDHTLRLVIIPQALRVIIPPLTSQYLNLTKNSSLAAAIAYPDLVLVFAGTALMQTGQAVEIIAITMACYLTLSLLISAFMNWYNRRIALVER